MSEVELQRKLTQAFIDDNPVKVKFERQTLIADGEGGWIPSGSDTLPSQVVRLVLGTRLTTSRTVTMPDGSIQEVSYTLVGMDDLDVKRGDKFDVGTDHCVVADVNLIQDWSVEAAVVKSA